MTKLTKLVTFNTYINKLLKISTFSTAAHPCGLCCGRSHCMLHHNLPISPPTQNIPYLLSYM